VHQVGNEYVDLTPCNRSYIFDNHATVKVLLAAAVRKL